MSAYEPPWRLTGTALVIVFAASKRRAEAFGALPESLQGRAPGGAGAIVLADYRESAVGPYRELLLAPGHYRAGRDAGHAVTRIYVDSRASAEAGRANWGLPKQTARLSAGFGPDGLWRFAGSPAPEAAEDAPAFALSARPCGPRFPVPLGALPARLMQEDGGTRFLTRPGGQATGRLARIVRAEADESFFPHPGRFGPGICVLLESFSLTFPPAEKVDAD
ncbi:acetoacetate decarboxylase family protein [Saccharibacillus sp. CPCC 101409]|uniref:acetoacetate decarboxylase family protein n=1 Tax=Saccharibacillus sp. CPCC 101409 TaxID=3058041 RepID=UPI0026715EC3|nr:acetoacetate decarboxylase family protein [Saccharibacillus sp. CPCC 101409]MDO3410435.1 acetoacetate decarboxylase family protein [Saccharibacillus sp. CPCC 101409]